MGQVVLLQLVCPPGTDFRLFMHLRDRCPVVTGARALITPIRLGAGSQAEDGNAPRLQHHVMDFGVIALMG